jgi:hypothetical protein
VFFENLGWRDAFLNAAMLLGGMGPVNPPQTDGGKLFAGIYALYAGLVFIITAALLFTPILHRVLHKFHWDDKIKATCLAAKRHKKHKKGSSTFVWFVPLCGSDTNQRQRAIALSG